jgi:hypothetical protein
MSYVEHCKKHGQHHGEICGECFEDLKIENARIKEALERLSLDCGGFCCDCPDIREYARVALEGK